MIKARHLHQQAIDLGLQFLDVSDPIVRLAAMGRVELAGEQGNESARDLRVVPQRLLLGRLRRI